SVITKHLRNVFREGELDKASVRAKFAHTASDGKKYNTQFYNLDAILSVGYRVNSKRGTQFRQWATNVLRDHLLQGFTVNRSRIEAKGLSEMQQAVELLARTLNNQILITEVGRDVLSVIVGYAKTWRLLLRYDEDSLVLPAGCQPSRGGFEYDFAKRAISELKQELKGRGDATDLFGAERSDALAAILGNIEQTMFGKPLYRTREEKAAHLLYFIIKDHPFLDGNKRIGSFLFLLYSRQELIQEIVSENTLTALALLIAESEPANKDLMIRLIVNLIVEG
ncbi:MAG: virulence protein RhuM/Fic/DOC family protein, partial [Nitrospirae bacterium]|nr:virulence protein RhuM/Fic/DOC family protein [Nitrospirota bacterium]